MTRSGWISLHRKIQESWVWSDATYFKAWVAMLMEVNHSPKKVLIKGKLLDCARGQSLNSLSTWGTLFGSWSTKKVRTFFGNLESDEMITTESLSVTTRITICNYDKYQNIGHAEDTHGTHTGHARDTHGTRTGNTNNNGNNSNNEKNEKKYPAEFERFWNSVKNKNGKKSSAREWSKLGSNRPETDFLIKTLKSQYEHKDYMDSIGKFCPEIPHIERWLKNRRFEDEIPRIEQPKDFFDWDENDKK